MKYFYCILIYCCISCGRNSVPEVLKQFYGKKISYENLSDINGVLLAEDSTACFRIIHYIDSSECVPCKLENLNLRKKHQQELSDLQIKII